MSIQTNPLLLDVSVVMPCLDEAETIGGCISECLNTFASAKLRGESGYGVRE